MEKQKRHFYSSFASRNPSLAPAGAVIQEDTLCAGQPRANSYSDSWFPSAMPIFHHRGDCSSSPFHLNAETIFTPNPGDVPCSTMRAPGWFTPLFRCSPGKLFLAPWLSQWLLQFNEHPQENAFRARQSWRRLSKQSFLDLVGNFSANPFFKQQ